MRSYDNCEYLETKRLEAIELLQSINKYAADPKCTWRPRPSAKTNVAKTWSEVRRREGWA
jgi:hypothetical protein